MPPTRKLQKSPKQTKNISHPVSFAHKSASIEPIECTCQPQIVNATSAILSIMRKELPKKLIIELLRNSKASDRNLAKKLGVSQPTLTRTRRSLEREKLIRSYTIIPDWRKLGFEILALTFVKMDPRVMSEELIGKVREYASKFSNSFFASTGEGIGMTGVIMSLHKDYRDYSRKLALFRQDWGQYMSDIQSFVTVTDEGVIKEFSFKYINEDLL